MSIKNAFRHVPYVLAFYDVAHDFWPTSITNFTTTTITTTNPITTTTSATMTGPGPAPNPRKRGPHTAPSNSSSASATTAAPDRKRARTATARTIAAQTDVPELRAGSLNVAGFVRVRKFEIAALQRAMASARGVLKQRAFQSVPRDLRRRTASHNAKRVPSRLRARAEREMRADNTPTHTFRRRAKSGRDRLRAETAAKLLAMGKKRELVERLVREQAPAASTTAAAVAAAAGLAKPPRAHPKHRKRQRAKTWLPTHVWHAKRAHMAVRWRFAVAESPTAKSFRSTQRAVHHHGAVAWDTSYWSSILLRGDELLLDRVLEAVCVGGGGGADGKVRMGRRAKECWAYVRGGFPTEPIAPVTVVWSPAEEAAGNGGSDSAVGTGTVTGTGTGRRVLIRLHPAAFLAVWTELRCAIADHNPAAGPPKIFMDDLRFELASIRIAGPSATDALLAVLAPVRPAGATETVWAGLRGLTNPAALPPDVVFGFSVSDPRLRFPPRPLDPASPQEQPQQSRLFAIQSTWPVPATPHALLDPRARTAAVKRLASQSHIDKRKAAAAPGCFPEPIGNDPEIPVMLLSTPLAGHGSSCRDGGSGGPRTSPGAWTVVLPWKWALPVWCALMKLADVRFGGIAEQRQMAFDHGLPWFPADFAGTPAGDDWEDEQATLRRETWDRKPRQKRLNYDAVRVSGPGSRGEVGEWSRCDWQILMTAPPPLGDATRAVPSTSSLLASTQTETQTQTPAPPPPLAERKQWWHMTAALIAACLRTPQGPGLPPSLPPSLQAAAVADSNGSGAPPLQNAIFTVKIVLLQRGSPSAGSRIYRLPAGDGDGGGARAWTALAAALRAGKGRKKHGMKDRAGVVQPGQDAYPACPGEDHLVGFVTTGNYSLSQGVAVAVGGIVYGAWFRAEPGQPSRASRDRLVVVRGVGETVARLGRWEVA